MDLLWSSICFHFSFLFNTTFALLIIMCNKQKNTNRATTTNTNTINTNSQQRKTIFSTEKRVVPVTPESAPTPAPPALTENNQETKKEESSKNKEESKPVKEQEKDIVAVIPTLRHADSTNKDDGPKLVENPLVSVFTEILDVDEGNIEKKDERKDEKNEDKKDDKKTKDKKESKKMTDDKRKVKGSADERTKEVADNKKKTNKPSSVAKIHRVHKRISSQRGGKQKRKGAMRKRKTTRKK
ncbi:unnamed protein product, partial [Mesorhabditis belari]|uniref:Uncharacterized protein n=1 Tax=Mesorhabditis belari TaxID=2138241 RepID=A0AAF3ESS9_9BILA